MLKNKDLSFELCLGMRILYGCSEASGRLKIGVAFETLQTSYWVESLEALKAKLQRRNIR